MSSPLKRKKTKPSARRRELTDAFILAGREGSTATVMFHAVIAERAGLMATDTKTLDILVRLGPLTAGELAAHTGLATASVTSLIDRLEKKGLVRRVRDAKDRRRVIVETVPERLAAADSMWTTVRNGFAELVDAYTDEQLETILDFMRRSAQRTRELTARISAVPPRK